MKEEEGARDSACLLLGMAKQFLLLGFPEVFYGKDDPYFKRLARIAAHLVFVFMFKKYYFVFIILNLFNMLIEKWKYV